MGGRNRAEWGQEVIALVAPVEGQEVDTAELDQLCVGNVARFKRPKDYRTTPALPKKNYGSIVKLERNCLEAEGNG